MVRKLVPECPSKTKGRIVVSYKCLLHLIAFESSPSKGLDEKNHQPDDLFLLKVGDIQYSFKPANLRTTIQHQTLDQSVSFFGPFFFWGGGFRLASSFACHHYISVSPTSLEWCFEEMKEKKRGFFPKVTLTMLWWAKVFPKSISHRIRWNGIFAYIFGWFLPSILVNVSKYTTHGILWLLLDGRLNLVELILESITLETEFLTDGCHGFSTLHQRVQWIPFQVYVAGWCWNLLLGWYMMHP